MIVNSLRSLVLICMQGSPFILITSKGHRVVPLLFLFEDRDLVVSDFGSAAALNHQRLVVEGPHCLVCINFSLIILHSGGLGVSGVLDPVGTHFKSIQLE